MGIAGRQTVPGSKRGRDDEEEKKPNRYTVTQCSVCFFSSGFRGHFEHNEKLFRRADTYQVYTNMVVTCKGDPPFSPRCRNEVLEANKVLLAAKPAPQASPREKYGKTEGNPGQDKGIPKVYVYKANERAKGKPGEK